MIRRKIRIKLAAVADRRERRKVFSSHWNRKLLLKLSLSPTTPQHKTRSVRSLTLSALHSIQHLPIITFKFTPILQKQKIKPSCTFCFWYHLRFFQSTSLDRRWLFWGMALPAAVVIVPLGLLFFLSGLIINFIQVSSVIGFYRFVDGFRFLGFV